MGDELREKKQVLEAILESEQIRNLICKGSSTHTDINERSFIYHGTATRAGIHPVEIKAVPRKRFLEQGTNFYGEVDALNRLQHAAFPKLYMPIVRGEWAFFISQQFPNALPADRVIIEPAALVEHVAVPLAYALLEMHERGKLLHGDFKESGVLVHGYERRWLRDRSMPAEEFARKAGQSTILAKEPIIRDFDSVQTMAEPGSGQTYVRWTPGRVHPLIEQRGGATPRPHIDVNSYIIAVQQLAKAARCEHHYPLRNLQDIRRDYLRGDPENSALTMRDAIRVLHDEPRAMHRREAIRKIAVAGAAAAAGGAFIFDTVRDRTYEASAAGLLQARPVSGKRLHAALCHELAEAIEAGEAYAPRESTMVCYGYSADGSPLEDGINSHFGTGIVELLAEVARVDERVQPLLVHYADMLAELVLEREFHMGVAANLRAPLTEAYTMHPDPRYLEAARAPGDWLLENHRRLPGGVMTPYIRNSTQIAQASTWLDIYDVHLAESLLMASEARRMQQPGTGRQDEYLELLEEVCTAFMHLVSGGRVYKYVNLDAEEPQLDALRGQPTLHGQVRLSNLFYRLGQASGKEEWNERSRALLPANPQVVAADTYTMVMEKELLQLHGLHAAPALQALIPHIAAAEENIWKKGKRKWILDGVSLEPPYETYTNIRFVPADTTFLRGLA